MAFRFCGIYTFRVVDSISEVNSSVRTSLVFPLTRLVILQSVTPVKGSPFNEQLTSSSTLKMDISISFTSFLFSTVYGTLFVG